MWLENMENILPTLCQGPPLDTPPLGMPLRSAALSPACMLQSQSFFFFLILKPPLSRLHPSPIKSESYKGGAERGGHTPLSKTHPDDSSRGQKRELSCHQWMHLISLSLGRVILNFTLKRLQNVKGNALARGGWVLVSAYTREGFGTRSPRTWCALQLGGACWKRSKWLEGRMS